MTIQRVQPRNFTRFIAYTGQHNWFLPKAMIPPLGKRENYFSTGKSSFDVI